MEIGSNILQMSEKEKLVLERKNAQFNKSMGKAENPSKSRMGQDEFLKLLVTQLSKQDPLSPMENTEFIAQMAQFTQLEQTLSMNKNIEGLRGDFQKLQSQTMIGKVASYMDPNTLDVKSGTINSVSFDGNENKSYFLIGDQKIEFNDIQQISNLELQNQTFVDEAINAYNKN